jgi:AcrR family transcriptional regulator
LEIAAHRLVAFVHPGGEAGDAGLHRVQGVGALGGRQIALQERVVVDGALGLVGEDGGGNARGAPQRGTGRPASALRPGGKQGLGPTQVQVGVGQHGHRATSSVAGSASGSRPDGGDNPMRSIRKPSHPATRSRRAVARPGSAVWTVKSSRPYTSCMIDLPRTAKGRATRARIIAAAAELVAESGVAETSLDDVIERAVVSKGQLYHYFQDKADLLRAVVAHQADMVLAAQEPELQALDGWDPIRVWFDRLVALQVQRQGCGGCPIGSLVSQLAETNEPARAELAVSFDRWERHLREGLLAMHARGELRAGADIEALATATMAAIQGGLVLTQARRDPAQLARALDAAYAHLRAQRASRRPARLAAR